MLRIASLFIQNSPLFPYFLISSPYLILLLGLFFGVRVCVHGVFVMDYLQVEFSLPRLPAAVATPSQLQVTDELLP